MAQIRRLDEAVINRIAAGEVIQRPANALKEMIENSLDAKSSNIQITVKNGGLKLLQIQDNGTGIRKDDFEILCERFTTSKLCEFEDLSSISTYGFRGEALASISHVAHLTIISKTAGEKCAYKASYEDGKIKDTIKPTAGNQGTQIIVEDLFYNMNIRKRALKSAPEEYQKISDVVGKYAIHNASIGFGLRKQGENNDIRTPPNSTHIDNIRIIYGNAIARELIEFKFNNEPFKFKASGYMTNVNYSTKKFTFLLFINHRLVECPGLKKCIDQVYSTYLPKNMHPFVFLSIELEPKSVDVNVHPTKHEVHFLNEDQIIELITTAVETKLLGSNNSRVFYTQAKLPGITSETAKLTDKDKSSNKTMQDKNLVRTDASEQKLTKFFGAPIRKSDAVQQELNESSFEAQIIDESKNFLEANENFEKMILDTTVQSGNKSPRNKSSSKMSSPSTNRVNSSLLSKVTRVETQLTSVLQLRKEVEDNCHLGLRELFSQHVFVGCVNPRQSLIQHNTKLYLCQTHMIMQDLFYQFIMYNFQNFGIIKFSDPLPIDKLALVALDLPENGWEPEDGDKDELARKIAEILTDKGEMLREYFSMEIDENGNLKTLPILIENYVPKITGLPTYVLRLATEVHWKTEKECFHSFAVETALYYSVINDEKTNEKWKWITEHLFYPAVKDYFLPPKSFMDNAVILEIADLPKLYRVFERC